MLRKNSKRLHPVEIALLAALSLFLASGAAALRTQDALAEKVVRLHVLANSDSAEDQALKLRVRDAVLAQASGVLAGVESQAEALSRLRDALPELRSAAQESAAGVCPVRVELEEVWFPTKTYEGFALPAGTYPALRVLLGEAAGQNWWCVAFPPLCTAAAGEVPAAALAAGLSDEQVALITETDGRYELKFKAVELWESLRHSLEELPENLFHSDIKQTDD